MPRLPTSFQIAATFCRLEFRRRKLVRVTKVLSLRRQHLLASFRKIAGIASYLHIDRGRNGLATSLSLQSLQLRQRPGIVASRGPHAPRRPVLSQFSRFECDLIALDCCVTSRHSIVPWWPAAPS
jgi:hypothetical protein